MAIKYKRKWIVPSTSRNFYVRDEDKKIIYIVAETEDGKFQCSCPAWIFQRKKLRNGECYHIQLVKHSPHEFEEVDPEITGSLLQIAKALGKKDNVKKESSIYLE